MNKVSAPILVLCVLAGCQSSPESGESAYDRVSREIERERAESAVAVSAGENINVVVNMLSTTSGDEFAIDSLWQYVNTNIAIAKRPAVFGGSGLRIGVGDKDFRVRLDMTRRQLKSAEDSELFIVLAEGARWFIFIRHCGTVGCVDFVGRKEIGFDWVRFGGGRQVVHFHNPFR